MTNPFYIDPSMFSRLKPPMVGPDETNQEPSQYETVLPGGGSLPTDTIQATKPGHPLASLGEKKKFDKSDFFLNLLSNFTYALGQGLSNNSGQGRAGDIQGMGAALVAPFQLKRIKQQEEFQRQQQERAQAQEELYRAQTQRQSELHSERTRQFEEASLRQQMQIAATLKNIGITTTSKEKEGEANRNNKIDVANIGTTSREGISDAQIASREKLANIPKNFNAAWIKAKTRELGRELTSAELEEGNKKLKPVSAIGRFNSMFDEANNVFRGFYNPTTDRWAGAPPGTRPGALPAGEMQNRVTLDILIEDTSVLKTLAEKHRNVIGPAAGRLATAVQQYAPEALQEILPSEYTEPEVVEMFRVAQNMRNQLLYALSGKQINEKEYARLSRLVPEVTTSPKTFFPRLQEYELELKRTLERRSGKRETTRESAPSKVVRTRRWNGTMFEEVTTP
jgi:hypothetical protein